METMLLELLEQWHRKERYDKVAETLEAMKPQEMNDNLYGQLARALNNLKRYEDALEVLNRVSQEGRDDTWWYRYGYALFYLERYEDARKALETVLSINPNDSEAEEFVQDCSDMLLRKQAAEPFCQRVEKFWNRFLSEEETLRKLLDEKDMPKAMELTASLLDICFSQHWMELGKKGEIYELTLSAEGQRHRLLMLNYWRDHAPGQLLERWNFHAGRRREDILRPWSLQIYDRDIETKDVWVWAEPTESKRLYLRMYSPVLAELLEEGDSGKNQAYSIGEILLDQAVGEITAINVVDGLELLSQKRPEPAIALTDLFDYVKEHCENWDANPVDGFLVYQTKPRGEELRLRDDIYVGNTRFHRLVGEFYSGEGDIFREGLENGVVFGYLFFNNDNISRKRMVAFRADLEEELEEKCDDAFTIIGGATGRLYSYIDVVCFDLQRFLALAKETLNGKEQLREIGFCEYIFNGRETDLRTDSPACYSEEEKTFLRSCIEEHFGSISAVLPGTNVDIAVVEPTEERKYFVLCTIGMGARRMNVPRNLRMRGVDRGELFLVLPADWNFFGEEKEWRWPVKWLESLAEYPFREHSWLGWGHTVPNCKPLAEHTQLSGAMLVSAAEFGTEAGECMLPDGDCINFYGVMALYEEEMEYVGEYGAQALLDLMKEENVTMRLDIHRQNLCQW